MQLYICIYTSINLILTIALLQKMIMNVNNYPANMRLHIQALIVALLQKNDHVLQIIMQTCNHTSINLT